MKAVSVIEPNSIRISDVPKPEVGPQDVLCKVKYCGICGTDLAILSGETSLVRNGQIKYPVRIGHEWSGIVEEVGEEVKDLKPGDRVVSDNGVTCGKCSHCLSGDYGACTHVHALGTVNAWDGAFAEYEIMPCRHIHKLPDSISLEEAALIEPATIALSALNACDFHEDQSVLVVGTGSIGLAAVALAKHMGASCVLLSGRTDFKLDIAKKLGADAVVNVSKDSLIDFVNAHTDGKGVDLVIEASGNIDSIGQCAKVTKRRGYIGIASFYEKELNNFDIDAFVFRKLHLRGVTGEYGLVPKIIDLISTKQLHLDLMVTGKYPLDDYETAFEDAAKRKKSNIKILVVMS